MPIVKMPDGTNVSFPDEMPREQIRDMIASKFPEAAGPQPGIREQAQAFAGSALEGIPIAGPYIKAGVERARAGFDALRNDTPFSQELAEAQGSAKANVAAFPKTALAGGVAGGVLGTIPMVAAAPGLFGAGAGSILARGGASLVSGAAIGAGDAAVRTGGDLEGIKEGAKWGGGLGLAGPLVGAPRRRPKCSAALPPQTDSLRNRPLPSSITSGLRRCPQTSALTCNGRPARWLQPLAALRKSSVRL
jgi:hypothetical protein